jgi:hypothetical protein
MPESTLYEQDIIAWANEQAMLGDEEWQEEIWADAVADAMAEAGLDDLPERCPWQPAQVLDPEWLPPSRP